MLAGKIITNNELIAAIKQLFGRMDPGSVLQVLESMVSNNEITRGQMTYYCELYGTMFPSTLSAQDAENKLTKRTSRYISLAGALSHCKLLLNLQLIDSAHNHVTEKKRTHHVVPTTAIIAYQRHDGDIGIFEYKCYYCETCQKYFDWKESFIGQMVNNRIEVSSLYINLDVTSGPIIRTKMTMDLFNAESELHRMGYKVGAYGLSQNERQRLLEAIIESKALPIQVVTETIQHDIAMFRNHYGMEQAVADWRSDLQYVNGFIRKKS